MRPTRTTSFCHATTIEEDFIIKTALAFSRCNHQYSLIIKHATQEIIFASGDFYSLCNMCADEVCKFGDDFFNKVIIPEEKRSLREIQRECNNFKWKEERLYALKSTERDMLLLSTQGLTVPQIATALCKSVEAIKSCRKLLYKRLGVKNTAEAMSFAVNFQLF